MRSPVGAHRSEVVLQSPAGSAARRAAELEPLADGAHDIATQLVLAREVPVEGGGLDAELARQAAQRERARAFGVHERDRLLDDLLPGQSRAPSSRAPAGRG